MAIEIFGNSKDCIDYALNQNGLTIDKLIITRDEFISRLSNPHTIQALLEGCKQLTTVEQFKALLTKSEVQEALKTPIHPDYIRTLMQKFQEYFSSFDQVELKNYSFMSSMNTDTYTITIRTVSNVTFSVQNIDKHALQSAFEEVFSKYFFASSTQLHLKELEFQIEITRFEDMKKHFYLYKQGSKLLLFSQLGLPQEINGSQYHVLGEQYSSYQNQLFYNKAAQEVIYSRQGSKLGYEQVQVKGKILEEQELIAIHQATNSLNDVCIEGFIGAKGKVQLTHIQIFNSTIENTFEDYLFLHSSYETSSQTQSDISIVPFHEIDVTTPHDKFVVLRNNAEFKTALNSNALSQVKGVIFTFSIFSPQLLSICKYSDINCIISKHAISKAMHATLNYETMEISIQGEKVGQVEELNPFSSILPQKSQEEIQKASELHTIQDELNMQATRRSQELQEQRSQAQFSSNQSPSYASTRPIEMNSSPSSSSSSSLYSNAPSRSSGEKKSALAMLADQVVNSTQAKAPQPQMSAPVTSTYGPSSHEQVSSQVSEESSNVSSNPFIGQNSQQSNTSYNPTSTGDQSSSHISQYQETHSIFAQGFEESHKVDTNHNEGIFEQHTSTVSPSSTYNPTKEILLKRLRQLEEEKEEISNLLEQL